MLGSEDQVTFNVSAEKGYLLFDFAPSETGNTGDVCVSVSSTSAFYLIMAEGAVAQKVSLSFTSKSKKVTSAHNLRQKSIVHRRDNEPALAQNVSHNVDDLFTPQKAEEIVIPLIQQNQWRAIKTPIEKPPALESESQSPSVSPKDKVTPNQSAITITTDDTNNDEEEQRRKEALDLILSASSNDTDCIQPILAPNVSTGAQSTLSSTGAFTQMRANAVPGVEEVTNPKKKLEMDCAQRPREPDPVEYESVPISVFGAALLKGMGWKKEVPVGNQYGANQLKIPKSVDIKPRPRMLGLGATITKEEADRMIARKFNKNKQRTEKERKRIKEIKSWTENEKDKERDKMSEPLRKRQKTMNSNDSNNGNGYHHRNGKEKEKKKKRKRIKWIWNGLRVRCIKEESKYFRKKGVVDDVIDEYRFTLRMNDDSRLLTLYEDEVETVIPRKGKCVMILRGEYRKEKATVLKKHKKDQCATLQLNEDLKIIECHYDDICAV